MQSILRGDDEEFGAPSRYYRTAAPASSPEQYHTRTQHGTHHRALSNMQTMAQYQQQQPRSVLHMQVAAHERLHNRGGSTQQQRGDFRFRKGGHRMVSTHDSNDDDGETSSASEDSATSAGYPSPPLARPATTALCQAGKRAQPSASFCLPPAQRSRIQPQKSDHDASLPAGWSPAINVANKVAGVACSTRDSPRQLPRLAALERLPKQGEAAQKCQEHDRNAYAHTSTTASPMQLPPLLGAARHVPNSTSSSSATSSSPLSSPTLHSVCSSSSGPPSPPQHAAQHKQQQQQQLPRPVPQHPPLHNNNPSHEMGQTNHWPATTTTNTTVIHGGGVEQQQWLPGGERRHVPRIDGLCAAAAPAPQPAGGLPQLRWGSGSAAWPKQMPGSSRSFEHNAGYDDKYNSDGRVEEERGWARQRGEWRGSGGWTREQQPERRGGGYVQRGPDERRHPVQPKGLHQPETSSRTPSPIYRRQAQPRSPPSPPAAIARAVERPATTRAWKSPEDGLAPGVGENHRGGDWASRGQHTPGTVGKQILQRYLAHLNPKASREVWSHDEEEVLWRAQKEYGNAWNYIAGLLPGRSENAVKNHWYTQMRMFIGQRGNNNTSGKLPPSASTDSSSSSSSSSSSCDKGSISTSNKAARPSRTQKKQEEDRAEAKQRAASAVTADVSANAAAAAAARAGEAERKARAEDEARVESVARAEAVAALGMLFSQTEGSRSCGDSPQVMASRPSREAVLPGFSIGVTSRA